MKRALFGVLALFCLVILIPAAFAEEGGAGTPWFKPTLRVGAEFDVGDAAYTFDTKGAALLGLANADLKLPNDARLYLATELPFAVTDRLTVAVGASWAFSDTGQDLEEKYNNTDTIRRYWERDDRGDRVTADFLVSYAILKDVSVIQDLSVVGGVRWDYRNMLFTDPHNALGVASVPGDTIDFRMQTLAPVFGLACTFIGRESGFMGGNIKLGVLAGPVVWGSVDYRESFSNVSAIRFKDDLSHGYIVKASLELPILAGPITPRLGGSLSFFANYTRVEVNGGVEGTSYAGINPVGRSPYDFEFANDVMVFGLAASLAFDLYGTPEPVSAPPAPAPVIEPKLEPMSQN